MLSDHEIIKQRIKGNIVIEQFVAQQLGTNSYDCRIGSYYFIGNHEMSFMRINSMEDIKRYWGEPINAWHTDHPGEIVIEQGTTILAHTDEYIGGKNGYLAKMHCRSSIARSGLSVCRCAGVGDVGYINRWTMEISNHTQTAIAIPVGYRVCQMLFEYVGETLQEYHGKYGQGAWSPFDMLPKPSLDWDRREVEDESTTTK